MKKKTFTPLIPTMQVPRNRGKERHTSNLDVTQICYLGLGSIEECFDIIGEMESIEECTSNILKIKWSNRSTLLYHMFISMKQGTDCLEGAQSFIPLKYIYRYSITPSRY